ncbi:hypothetical protein SAMN05444287_2166, partial [Octadecabacter temperatus]
MRFHTCLGLGDRENERDEDLGDGRVGQLPAGSVVMVDLTAGGL